MDQTEIQMEENRQWLSLLPLFETDHWPMVNVTNEDPWLATCICYTEEHDTISLFPYARYGARGAWYEMEEHLVELAEHYLSVDPHDFDARDIAEERICASWPTFFQRIFQQTWDYHGEMWCLAERADSYSGCDDSPYWYPFWATDEVRYRHCTCTAEPVTHGDSFDSISSDDSGDESDDWNLGDRSAVWQHDYSIRDPRDIILLEDGSTINFGYHGQGTRSSINKGYQLSRWEPWSYQVEGRSTEVDNPPRYSSVSELPSYEESQNPPPYGGWSASRFLDVNPVVSGVQLLRRYNVIHARETQEMIDWVRSLLQ